MKKVRNVGIHSFGGVSRTSAFPKRTLGTRVIRKGQDKICKLEENVVGENTNTGLIN